MFKYPFKDNIIKTKFGIYYIRPQTVDAITVSPAYERKDLNFLKRLIENNIDKNILFLDIGANIGGYNINIANTFRDKKELSIYSFESLKCNYEILIKNIEVNRLYNKIKPIKKALSLILIL